MDKQQLNITAAVTHKSAVELIIKFGNNITGEDDMVNRVDKLARMLFAKHCAWISELTVNKENGN